MKKGQRTEKKSQKELLLDWGKGDWMLEKEELKEKFITIRISGRLLYELEREKGITKNSFSSIIRNALKRYFF